jgi:hypothetical protein
VLDPKLRQRIISKIPKESSDSVLAEQFGTSRKTVWRLRQEAADAKKVVPQPKIKAKPVVLVKKKAEAKPEAVVAPTIRAVEPPKKPVEVAPPAPETVKVVPVSRSEPVREAPKVEPIVAPKAPIPVPIPLSVALPPLQPKPIRKSDVMPKVDTEAVALSNYFSVHILRGESYRTVSKLVLDAAEADGVLFRKLQVMDIHAVGTTPFVRFRSDVDLTRILSKLEGRGTITVDPATGSYMARFVDGRGGKYPTSVMNAAPKLGFGQIFAATRIKRWRAQFDD